MVNAFGEKFSFATFGESHGRAVGCVLEGVPAGLKIDEEFLQACMDARKPGGRYATARKEGDRVEILSGVFEGRATGTPLAMVVFNTNQKSKDYDAIKDIFRPGHADFTYFRKYGIRDYRGGGRSSARESAARVAAGAVAKMLLREFDISVIGGVADVGSVEAGEFDFANAHQSEIRALDPRVESAQKDAIVQARSDHDSLGSVVRIKAFRVPAGLGEPMYHKLDGAIGEAMLGLNGVKAVSVGAGEEASKKSGYENNDQINSEGFCSNNSGGVLGGISSGQDIEITVHFKPTPSIFKPMHTVDTQGREQTCELKGRHDPCIGIRGSVVCEAMLAVILADMLLLNATSKLENVKKVYG